MPVLYHYSPLLHLPGIVASGWSRGEIIHPDPTVYHQAVSLTTQPDPERLACWATERRWRRRLRSGTSAASTTAIRCWNRHAKLGSGWEYRRT